MKLRPLTLFTFIALTFPCAGYGAETRSWTATDGRAIEGEYLGGTDVNIELRLVDGRRVTVPLSRLSEADREWVRSRADAAESEKRRLLGVEEGPYAEAIKGEWVVFPKDRHGLIYQFYATRDVKRGKEGELFPLYLHLHGAAGRKDEIEAGKVEIGASTLVKKHYDGHPCFVCVPLCPSDEQWGQQGEKLEAIIDELVANLPVDRDRIYLGGYSMGAGGIGNLISRRPESYAGALFADGQPKDDWPGKVKTSLWFFMSGERDASQFQSLSDRFAAAGTEMKFSLFPEAEHNGIHWKMANEPKAYEWLFEQRLSK